MPLVAFDILVGFVVGFLIGLSSIGSGVLLPVLIFGLRVPALVAVGSVALFNFFTKIPAALMHLRKGTVRPKPVVALAIGSIPGSFAGISMLVYIHQHHGNGVNTFIKTTVGILLILIPALVLFQKSSEDEVTEDPPTTAKFVGMVLIGLVAGFVVNITSMGSGIIVMMLLATVYSFPAKVNVGSDIVHAVLLTGITGFLHFRLGNVDPVLVLSLLVGSLPGVLFGSHLVTSIPSEDVELL